ncbi:hypothetical protein LZ198_00830 [Myxococcus sp. K15C18031901]|uniref:hypothetical protein n=1 Tax=Myxococcus dinghuensis TaxID=2906761 RepID=UPI0020A825BE|nr:hypothetical protein [Myxococcus dinghuensis]MCP3097410.1 hypothetical protein [Myxococcus dinghuensis]
MSGAHVTPSRPVPGDALLHPLVFGAVLVLILNDHVLKARYASWWTGKLSDVAGLAMFPLVLQGLWEQVRARGARGFRPSSRVLLTCVLLTAACFGAVKVSQTAGDGWRWALGGLQWPARAAWALASGRGVPAVVPVAHVVDVTDLLALPALLVAWRVGRRRCADDSRAHGGPSTRLLPMAQAPSRG